MSKQHRHLPKIRGFKRKMKRLSKLSFRSDAFSMVEFDEPIIVTFKVDVIPRMDVLYGFGTYRGVR